MQNTNYQKNMDRYLKEIDEQEPVPKLLLHSCCAPCSSYVLEYLSDFFEITVFFYNPNIDSEEEYLHRKAEQKRLISEMQPKNPLSYIDENYDSSEFLSIVSGLENEPEGRKRCQKCFALRLEKTAQKAKELEFPLFATTLTLSPLKNAPLINRIGEAVSEKHGVLYLASDFKKKDGYKRSITLSRQYGLYRQNYCGCIFSKQQQKKPSQG